MEFAVRMDNGGSSRAQIRYSAGKMTVNSNLVKPTVVSALGRVLFGFDTAAEP
jgi:hypothetical protein